MSNPKGRLISMDYDKSLIGDECLLDVIQQVLSEYPPPLDEAVEVEGLPTIRIADLCCGNGNFGLAVVSLFMKSHKIILHCVDTSLNDEYLTSRNTENLQVITHVQDLEKDEALQDLEKVDLVLMNPPFDRIPKFSTQALKIMKEGAVFLLIGFKRKSPIQYLSLKQELMITKPVYVAGTRINFPTYLRIMMKESVVSLFSSSTELIKQEIKPLIVEQKKLMVRRVNTQFEMILNSLKIWNSLQGYPMTPSDSEECKSLLLSWALPTILKPRQEVLDQITKFFGVDIPLNLFVGKLGKVKTQDEHFLFQLTMYLFDAVSLFYANGRNQEWIDALGRPGLTLDNFVNVAMNAMHEVVRESVNSKVLFENLRDLNKPKSSKKQSVSLAEIYEDIFRETCIFEGNSYEVFQLLLKKVPVTRVTLVSEMMINCLDGLDIDKRNSLNVNRMETMLSHGLRTKRGSQRYIKGFATTYNMAMREKQEKWQASGQDIDENEEEFEDEEEYVASPKRYRKRDVPVQTMDMDASMELPEATSVVSPEEIMDVHPQMDVSEFAQEIALPLATSVVSPEEIMDVDPQMDVSEFAQEIALPLSLQKLFAVAKTISVGTYANQEEEEEDTFVRCRVCELEMKTGQEIIFCRRCNLMQCHAVDSCFWSLAAGDNLEVNLKKVCVKCGQSNQPGIRCSQCKKLTCGKCWLNEDGTFPKV